MTESPSPWRDLTISLPERFELCAQEKAKARNHLDQAQSAYEFVIAQERLKLRGESQGSTRQHSADIEARIIVQRQSPDENNLIRQAWEIFSAARAHWTSVQADYIALDRAEWRESHFH